MAHEIIEETLNKITIIKLNRPEKRNALNYAMVDKLVESFVRLEKESNCKAIVLTGIGNLAFCSGMDLSVLKNFDAQSAVEWVSKLKVLYSSIRLFNKPCIGAINGIAAGAGYQIALLCDLRVGSPSTTMSQPEINVGLPSIIGPGLMFSTIGLSKTSELAYTGRSISPKELLELGLVYDIVPENILLTEAIEMAENLANKSPVAFKLTKCNLRDMTQKNFDEVFNQAMKFQKKAFTSGEPQKIISSKLNR